MRHWAHCMVAFVLVSCADAPTSAPGERVAIWADHVVMREESLDLDRLVLRAGARIVVQGVYLRVRVTELVIEGPVEIDARGVAGTPLDEPVWTSGGGALDDCDIAHRDWGLAVRAAMAVPTDTAQRGRRGRDAGSVTLIAQRVVGRPGDLHVDVRGGEGGPGRVLACGCRDHTHERGQYAAGRPGADGRWIFVQE